MVISQLSTCEECRDGSCRRCKSWVRRYKRKHPNAPKTLASAVAARRAGLECVEVRPSELVAEDFLGLPVSK